MGFTGRVKLLQLVVLVVVATALTIAGIVVVLAVDPRPSPPALLLAVGAVTVFVVGPVLLGAVAAYWDVRGSTEAARSFRAYRWVVFALEGLAAAAIVVFAVLEGMSPLLRSSSSLSGER